MFRWHSTVVQPARPMDAASSTPAADQTKSPAEKIIEKAHACMVQAGAGLQRDAQNKVINVRPLIDACTSEGVQLSPQGRGMLCALADRVPIRPPSLQEFMACCNTDGTVITGPRRRPAVAAAVASALYARAMSQPPAAYHARDRRPPPP